MDTPRALLLNEFAGRWSFDNAPEMFVDASGVAAWALALKGDYWGGTTPSPAQLGEYDLVVANMFPTHIEAYAKLAAARPTKVKWVSLIEGPGEDHYNEQPHLRAALDAADLVININRLTTEFIQSLTKTPVHCLGVPYPVESMRKRRVHLADRKREVLLCPRSQRLPSIEVAKRSGLTIRAYAPKVSRTVSNLPIFIHEKKIARDIELNKLRDLLPEGSLVGYEKYDAPYFAETASCFLWVNLDPRYTWGRFVLDAAALAIPIVTTESTGHGPILFPHTTVRNPFQVDLASDMARRLIADDGFYKDTVEFADAKLDAFSYEAAAKALLKLLW